MPKSPPLCLGAVCTSFNAGPGANNYTTVLTLSAAQLYSVPTNSTYASASYNCSSITAGMYFSNADDMVFLISSITSQSANTATVVLQDVGAMNAILSPGTGVGSPKVGTLGYIFELNASGYPILYDIITPPSVNWATTIMSRFLLTASTAIGPTGTSGSTGATGRVGSQGTTGTSNLSV